MMKTKVKSNSCAFDSDSLDDWLENDLRQSGILPSKSEKGDNDDKCKPRSFGDGSDDKTVVDDSETENTTSNSVCKIAPSSTTTAHLAPILKALLITLQQQQQRFQQSIMIPPLLSYHSSSTSTSPTPTPISSSSLTPDSINPLHISKTPGIHTKPSTFNTWNTPTATTTTTATTTAAATATTTTTAAATKKRRREMNSAPDPANVVDPLVLKRLKNTDAARRSRQRKLMKMEGLQTRVVELERINEELQLKVTMAENERDTAKVKEAKLRENVATLEAQLAKAHQSLLATVKQDIMDPSDDDGDDSQA